MEGLVEFVEVARSGSFTAAARRLGFSKSHVSKQVKQVEERLGVQLLRRTTRSVGLTDEGALLFERGAALVDEFRELERSLGERGSAPRGALKVSLPSPIGEDVIAPRILDFAAKYPDLRLVLNVTNRKVDVMEEGFDLAIRGGRLQDSAMLSRRVGAVNLRVFASPSYLQRCGVPVSVSSLSKHRWILFSQQPGGGLAAGVDLPEAMRGLPEALMRERRVVLDSNDLDVLVDGCRRGMGLCVLPLYQAQADVDAGRLVAVLPKVADIVLPLWAIYPANRYANPKVRLLLDALTTVPISGTALG